MRGSYRWGLLAALIALPALFPITVVFGSLFSPDMEVWQHLAKQVLPRVVGNTLVLGLSVTILSTSLGVALAWFTAACDFPGRRFFSWALFLPLAVPGYVMAFVFVGWFEYSGPLQTLSRELFGTADWFPNIKSVGGVIMTLTLVLFPYPYLVARNAFLTQGQRSLEVAQSLGLNRVQGFFKVTLPLARPWIVGGAMLVLMETLADFGTVSVFNFDTFTTAIYKSWFGLFSIAGALQLASVLMIFVLMLILAEKQLRARRRYHVLSNNKTLQQSRIKLTGGYKLAVMFACGTVFVVAFILPFIQLTIWAVQALAIDFDYRYARFAFNSLSLSLGSSVLVAILSLLLAYAVRQKGLWATTTARLATLGYALPGVVLAVGIFVPVVTLGNVIQSAADSILGLGVITVLLQGTLLIMFLAYVARFMAVAYTPIESSMQRVTTSIDDASQSMGVVGLAMLLRVHLPILKSGVLTAMALVFVDTMKELPITLMTRPYGWDTLAIRVFELTSEGFWERAALPGLAIVLAGLIPVAILIWKSDRAA